MEKDVFFSPLSHRAAPHEHASGMCFPPRTKCAAHENKEHAAPGPEADESFGDAGRGMHRKRVAPTRSARILQTIRHEDTLCTCIRRTGGEARGQTSEGMGFGTAGEGLGERAALQTVRLHAGMVGSTGDCTHIGSVTCT